MGFHPTTPETIWAIFREFAAEQRETARRFLEKFRRNRGAHGRTQATRQVFKPGHGF